MQLDVRNLNRFGQDGILLQNKTIEEVAENLKEGDIIVKGGNALDLKHRRAAVLIGNPTGGTIFLALQAAIGKRVRLIMPIGLEKRVTGDLNEIARKVNAPGSNGLRLMPAPGEVFTELEAVSLLTGAEAQLIAAGGISGAEGCIYLSVSGTPEAEQKAEQLLKSVVGEPGFEM